MKSNSYNFIFIDVPKTGGSSIITALRPFATSLNKHYPMVNYIAEAQEDLGGYFKFTFVRNPWDWVVSWYFYRKKQYNEDIPFKEWLMDEKSPAYYFGMGLAFDQSFFIRDNNGDISLDFIGRFENIQEDFNYICSKLNIPFCTLIPSNQTEHNPYWEYYDDESRDFVGVKFEKDVNSFSYDFIERGKLNEKLHMG